MKLMKSKSYILILFLLNISCDKNDNKLIYLNEIQSCEKAESKGLLATAVNACNRALDVVNKNQLAENLKSQVLYKLARIKRQQGRFSEAEKMLKESLVMEERRDKADYYELGLRLEELTLCLAGQNKWLEGAQYLQHLLQIIDDHKQNSFAIDNIVRQYINRLRINNHTVLVADLENKISKLK